MNKFKLSHLVLYAKGWYKRTDNVWEDLKKILELDNYTPFSDNDVYFILLSNLEKSDFDYRFNDLKQVMIGIHPSECWKTGYYIKGNNWVKGEKELPDYDMPTAFIYYVLSNLRFLDKKYWIPVTPKYKLYPKGESITLKKVIDQFNFKK